MHWRSNQGYAIIGRVSDLLGTSVRRHLSHSGPQPRAQDAADCFLTLVSIVPLHCNGTDKANRELVVGGERNSKY